MTARKVLSIVGLCLTAFLIVNMFLPFISAAGSSLSFWEYLDEIGAIEVDVVILLELVMAMIFFILQLCGAIQHVKFVYFTLGYYVTYNFVILISFIRNERLKYLSVGFYLGFIISLALLIITIISGKVNNKARPKYYGYREPKGYDPKTGKPIYDSPVERKPVRYNPHTGEPIYED